MHAEFDPTRRKLVGVVRLPCTACLAGQHTEQVGYPQGYFAWDKETGVIPHCHPPNRVSEHEALKFVFASDLSDFRPELTFKLVLKSRFFTNKISSVHQVNIITF